MLELDQALAHHQAGRLDQAQAAYRQILAREPENPDALHLLGMLTAQTGNSETAVELIRQAIRIDPDMPDYHNNLGEILRALGQIDAAIAAYRNALTLRPDYIAAHHNLGNALQEHGDLEAAIVAYRRVIELAPNDAAAHNNLGVTLGQHGDLADAITHLKHARSLDPQSAEICFNLGHAFAAYHEFPQAIAAYRDAIALKSDFAEAYYRLGIVLMFEDAVSEAIATYEQAIDLKPDYAEAYNELGNAALRLEGEEEQTRRNAAIYLYREALGIDPNYTKARLNLGVVLQIQGDLAAAVDSYKNVLQLEPENAEAWTALGSALNGQKQPQEAIAAHRRALQIRPDYMEAHCGLGRAYLNLGDLESAEACYRKAIEIDPESSLGWTNLSAARRFAADDMGATEGLQKLLADPTITDSRRIRLHFALAKIYDDCQRFDDAFKHYHAANRLKHKTLNFDRAEDAQGISDTISTYSADFFQQRIGYGSASDMPIFIVGMPRSGTTLVEQILAMHPLVFGAGELKHMGDIAAGLQKRLDAPLPHPQCAELIDASMANTLAEEYLEQIRSVAGGAGRVTDKMPGNYTLLGLIALLFPRTRVIHCQRDPLDVCLSIYFRHFKEGHAYAYDLADAGFRYRQYERLMNHWHKVLPLQVYDVQYEQLVADPEAGTRGLLEYCGLPWDERCLRPYESKRPIYTASVWQVRQPIYKDSVHRWKRYERYLSELKEALFAPNETDTRTLG